MSIFAILVLEERMTDGFPSHASSSPLVTLLSPVNLGTLVHTPALHHGKDRTRSMRPYWRTTRSASCDKRYVDVNQVHMIRRSRRRPSASALVVLLPVTTHLSCPPRFIRLPSPYQSFSCSRSRLVSLSSRQLQHPRQGFATLSTTSLSSPALTCFLIFFAMLQFAIGTMYFARPCAGAHGQRSRAPHALHLGTTGASQRRPVQNKSSCPRLIVAL